MLGGLPTNFAILVIDDHVLPEYVAIDSALVPAPAKAIDDEPIASDGAPVADTPLPAGEKEVHLPDSHVAN
jgi:hypothetical protein